jgi:predicted acetyltransferase
VKLVRLSAAIEPAVRELAAEYEAEGIERFEAILQDYAGAVRAAGATEIHAGVPYTFFLAQREDGLLVGTIRVRHELTEGLWQDGGNVGYEVRPSLWNRGYATRMLALALTEARRIGLDWVLLTVAPTNAASIRVIEKNGGARIGVGDRSGYLQYRIESCEAP